MAAVIAVLAAVAAGDSGSGGDRAAYEYFANPWGVVGLEDYRDGARIAPDGAILLGGKRRAEILLDRPPSDLRRARRGLARGYLPIVAFAWPDARPRWEIEIFAVPLDPRRLELFAGPAEGENFLVAIGARPEGAGSLRLRFPGTPPALRDAAGRKAAIARHKGPAGEGPIVALLSWTEGSLSADGEDLVWKAPGEGTRAELRAFLPYQALAESGPVPREVSEPGFFRSARMNLARFWDGVLARGARLFVPEAKPLATWRASIVFQLIARDGPVIKPGEGFYDQFYARDAAFQLYSLQLAGYLEETRASAEVFLRHRKPDGRFESQKGELDGNGQALWALWARYALTRDRAWLEHVFPAMAKAAAWIAEARRREKGPFPGVLPRAPADGENLWDGTCHIVGYDLWNLRGLDCARRAAEALGRREEARRLAREYRDYLAAFRAALARQDSPGLPPSYEGRGTSWGNLTALHPTRILDPRDPRVVATLLRERGAFVEGTIRWSPQDRRAIHPYMSTYITCTEIVRGEQEMAVDHFYHLLAHTTAMQGFPEGVYHDRRTAWGDTVPHQWAAAQYMILLRTMLVREEGERIHLLSAVPPSWLAPGGRIAFRRAPTALGRIGFELRARQGGADLAVELEDAARARGIVLHLPPAFRGIGAEGPAASGPAGRVAFDADGTLRLPPRRATWRIRWTRVRRGPFPRFEDYARRYAAQRLRLLRPVEGLLAEPVEVPRDRAAFVDLAAFADSDPRRAPFGVDTGGRLVFAGLPAGEVRAAGVPFRLIDPARNGDRALVVLHGQGGSARFPRAVRFPVGIGGRRIFFLGQVGGWVASERAGVVVGRYVIRYADGRERAIPLRIGATIDDWLQPPAATQVWPGLRRGAWHLHVLGAPLRAVTVRSIRFEDAGTPSAPVLAAVTIERR